MEDWSLSDPNDSKAVVQGDHSARLVSPLSSFSYIVSYKQNLVINNCMIGRIWDNFYNIEINQLMLGYLKIIKLMFFFSRRERRRQKGEVGRAAANMSIAKSTAVMNKLFLIYNKKTFF